MVIRMMIFIFVLVFASISLATTKHLRIYTNNGMIYKTEKVIETNSTIGFVTHEGVAVALPKENLKKIVEVKEDFKVNTQVETNSNISERTSFKKDSIELKPIDGITRSFCISLPFYNFTADSNARVILTISFDKKGLYLFIQNIILRWHIVDEFMFMHFLVEKFPNHDYYVFGYDSSSYNRDCRTIWIKDQNLFTSRANLYNETWHWENIYIEDIKKVVDSNVIRPPDSKESIE